MNPSELLRPNHQSGITRATNRLVVRSILILLTGSLAPLNAALLISDNFNVADSLLDTNNGLDTRQAGSLKGATGLEWITTNAPRNIVGNQVQSNLDGTAASRAFLNHDFTDSSITDAGGFVVDYTFIPGASSANWLGLGLGATTTQLDAGGNLATVYDFGFFIRNNGDFFIYKDQSPSVAIVANGISSISSGTSYDISLQVLTANFELGTAATVSVTINGVVIDLNGGTAGTGSSFTWDGDESNYISWESNHAASHFDNVSIASIPEPHSALVAGASGLLLLTRRGRGTGKGD